MFFMIRICFELTSSTLKNISKNFGKTYVKANNHHLLPHKLPYFHTYKIFHELQEHHLKAHEYTHSGKKPWECPHCGRRFNQKANMQRHLLIHNAERRFKCETCKKTFTQPQTLKAHMVVHADRKPHECHICGKNK